jgi:hypothetical protein
MKRCSRRRTSEGGISCQLALPPVCATLTACPGLLGGVALSVRGRLWQMRVIFLNHFAPGSRSAVILAIATIRAPTAGMLRNARIARRGNASAKLLGKFGPIATSLRAPMAFSFESRPDDEACRDRSAPTTDKETPRVFTTPGVFVSGYVATASSTLRTRRR